jgi:hypothetical protein
MICAPKLAVELREAINGWFAARGGPIHDSEMIMAALADLAAEQVAANPTPQAQTKVLNRFIRDIIRGLNAANRRRMGGVQVGLFIKQ